MREINICFEITIKVFVPTLVLSEDAEVICSFMVIVLELPLQ